VPPPFSRMYSTPDRAGADLAMISSVCRTASLPHSPRACRRSHDAGVLFWSGRWLMSCSRFARPSGARSRRPSPSWSRRRRTPRHADLMRIEAEPFSIIAHGRCRSASPFIDRGECRATNYAARATRRSSRRARRPARTADAPLDVGGSTMMSSYDQYFPRKSNRSFETHDFVMISIDSSNRADLPPSDAEAGEFVVPVAFADAEIQPPAGQQIDRRRLLGQQYRLSTAARSPPAERIRESSRDPGQQVQRRRHWPKPVK